MQKIVRAFVIALTLTGAAAAVNSSNAATTRPSPRPGSLPIPTCPPGDPNACGLGK